MSVGIVGAGANANAATGTTVAFTLPGSIPANSRLYLVTNSNGQLDTVTGVSNVTATQLDAQSPGTSMAASLQAADVGSANNGQTVTITWSGNGKLSCAWIVLSSAAASVDNQAVGLDNTNTNTACPVPSITPVAGTCFLVSLVAGQHATGGTTLTWDGDYTAGGDAIGTTATPLQSSHVGYFQLATGAGVPRSGDQHTWSANSREVSWVLSIAEQVAGSSDPPIIVMPPRRH